MKMTINGGNVQIYRSAHRSAIKRIMSAPLGSPIRPLLHNPVFKVDNRGGITVTDAKGVVRVRLGTF